MAVTDPRSRNEQILRATIDGTEYVAPPQSRIEDLLIQLKEAIEQGGGGGGGDVTGVKGSAESTYRKGNVNLTAENIGVEAGAEVNAIASISLNGDPITPDANKNVALVVITNTVNNLVNYYLKTETYSKSEVDAIAALLKNGRFISVNELPTTDIDQSAIYLVPKSSAQTNNVKDEYINLDGTSAGWEKIGDTQIDLSDYVTTTQLTTALADYTTTTALTALLADKVDKVSGKGLSTNDYDNTEKQKVTDAQPKTLATPIEVEGVQQTTVEGALGAINNKSGTGSIDHYSQLPDKPQINSVELEGNKSLADLGIQPAEQGKGLSTNDYTDADKAALANKVDKESGKGLSTNDYTSADKAKLESLTRVQYDVMPTASGARVGMVVQYIGATNANYTHNYVYECVDNGGSYAWERKDVQPNEGSGHTIENASGTALTQRDTLQFKGGLGVSDDSTNEVTVVSDEYEKITWETWDAMTPQEKAQHPNVIVTGKPYTPPTPPTPSLVAWSTGTDEEITAMVEGYYDGTFTLQDIQSVWSVGDVRTVSLSAMAATGVGESHRAQDVQMQIIDFDHDTLTTAINGKTKALITVQQKDCLMDAECAAGAKYGSQDTENGYMNSALTSSGGWKNSARRAWCNAIYYGALSTSLRPLIKLTVKSTGAGSKSTTIETTNDFCFLLSSIEVFGENYGSASGEGTQYAWFADTTNNRFKNPSWSSSLSSSLWWTRSPDTTYNGNFVLTGNNMNTSNANDVFGIAPAMCL